MSEVEPNDVLHTLRPAGFVVLVGADAQEQCALPVHVVDLLRNASPRIIQTSGPPLWFGPTSVMLDLTYLSGLVEESDRKALDRALDLVAYALR